MAFSQLQVNAFVGNQRIIQDLVTFEKDTLRWEYNNFQYLFQMRSKNFGNNLYRLLTKLVGLKSLTSTTSSILGIKEIKVEF